MNIKNLFRRNNHKPEIKQNKYVVYVSEEANIPYEKALAMMTAVKNDYPEYGISFYQYAKNRLFEYEGEALSDAVKRVYEREERISANNIKGIMTITGQSQEEVEARMNYVKEAFKITPKKYRQRMYYLLTDEEIEQDIKDRAADKEQRTALIIERSGKPEAEVRKHMLHVFLKYALNHVDYFLAHGWELTDEELDTYLTVDHSKLMPLKYNDPDASKLADNKILFNKTFADYTNRKFWVNDDTSYEEFCDFLDGLDYIFIKQVNLCQGKGARKVKLADVKDTRKLYDDLMSEPRVIVEEGVVQHPIMSQVHPNSINTVRTFCLQEGDEVHVLAAFVRFGMNGSVVDNMLSGGTIGGVNEVTGIIDTPIFDKEGNTYEVHPNSGVQILGMQIPMWDEIIDVSKRALKHVDGLNYVGWDIAITEKGPVLIEANTMPGLATYQVCYSHYKQGKKYKFEKYL